MDTKASLIDVVRWRWDHDCALFYYILGLHILSESLTTGQYRHDCYSSDEVCKCVNRVSAIFTGCLLATGMDKMPRSTL